MVTMGRCAKIFAVGAFGFADGDGAAFGVFEDGGRKNVGQVMLANDDFDVDAHVAGAAEDFDDASDGGSAFAGIAD